MSKVDDGLRPILRNNLIPLGFDMQSVETGGTGAGVPDLNYCIGGTEGWIECKATDGRAVRLAPAQIGWIERRLRHGGRVWVAVRCHHKGGARKGPPADELWLIPGELARVALLDGLGEALLGRGATAYHGGQALWDWPAIAARLR